MRGFNTETSKISVYLAAGIEERRKAPRNDLLTRLLEAEVQGDRFSHEEILAFFLMLMFAGQETTTNLAENAVLSLLDHPSSSRSSATRRNLCRLALKKFCGIARRSDGQ